MVSQDVERRTKSRLQWRSQLKILRGAKYTDFKRTTVYGLRHGLSKHKTTRCARNLGQIAASTPGYAYARLPPLSRLADPLLSQWRAAPCCKANRTACPIAHSFPKIPGSYFTLSSKVCSLNMCPALLRPYVAYDRRQPDWGFRRQTVGGRSFEINHRETRSSQTGDATLGLITPQRLSW